MAEYNAHPLSWPLGWKRTKFRTHSRFGKWNAPPTVAKGRDAIIAELRRMGVPDFHVVISTNIPLRRDGLPYSNQKEPDDTGSAVYFKLDGKDCVLACDKWNTVGDNLWAIAKHIEALRGQERWGVGTIEQAFAGYARLPEKTEDSWHEVLGVKPNATIEDVKTAYRSKANIAHPDKGGTVEDFQKIQRAYENARQCLAAA
jgi:hypothetical protein